jgi:thiol-disulfide isomerase/thioredoxin
MPRSILLQPPSLPNHSFCARVKPKAAPRHLSARSQPLAAVLLAPSPSPVLALPSAAALRALLGQGTGSTVDGGSPGPEVVVVKLFAGYCRACLGVAPRFAKSARAFFLEGADVAFAEMDYEQNEKFCKEKLGCETLPFFAIFKRGPKGAVLVDGISLPWNKLGLLDRKVEELLRPVETDERLTAGVDVFTGDNAAATE